MIPKVFNQFNVTIAALVSLPVLKPKWSSLKLESHFLKILLKVFFNELWPISLITQKSEQLRVFSLGLEQRWIPACALSVFWVFQKISISWIDQLKGLAIDFFTFRIFIVFWVISFYIMFSHVVIFSSMFVLSLSSELTIEDHFRGFLLCEIF